MSPMVPFITEHVWQTLIRVGDPSATQSVHLSSFPVAQGSAIDTALSNSVALSRAFGGVRPGGARRIKDQDSPTPRTRSSSGLGLGSMDQEIREHIQDELNVLRIDLLSEESEGLVSISLKANFRSIGARYGADVQAIAAAIAASDAAQTRHRASSHGSYTIAYGDKSAVLTADDLVITETPKEGWSVASHAGESVALDLTLTPALLQAGLMREVIRTIQEQRKNSGFDISDRIHVRWNSSADVMAAIKHYEAQIADEVLAITITQDESLTNFETEIGLALALTKA